MPTPTTIIQTIAHPPFGIISRELHAAIDHTALSIQRIRGPVNVDAFGLSFSFLTVPAAFGSSIGLVTRYEERILQFAPLYTDLSGHTFHSQVTDVHEEGLYYYFEDLFPTRVDVYVTIGCVVIPSWLVAL